MLGINTEKKLLKYQLIFERLYKYKITATQMEIILYLAQQKEWVSMANLVEYMFKKNNVGQEATSKNIKRIKSHDFLEEKKEGDRRFKSIRLNKRAFVFINSTFFI